MSYFDSAKNRTLWLKELSYLREEKERRAREGYSPDATVSEKRMDNPNRVPMTFAQLVREEERAVGENYLKSMEAKRQRWKQERQAQYQKEQEEQKQFTPGKERSR